MCGLVLVLVLVWWWCGVMWCGIVLVWLWCGCGRREAVVAGGRLLYSGGRL